MVTWFQRNLHEKEVPDLWLLGFSVLYVTSGATCFPSWSMVSQLEIFSVEWIETMGWTYQSSDLNWTQVEVWHTTRPTRPGKQEDSRGAGKSSAEPPDWGYHGTRLSMLMLCENVWEPYFEWISTHVWRFICILRERGGKKEKERDKKCYIFKFDDIC